MYGCSLDFNMLEHSCISHFSYDRINFVRKRLKRTKNIINVPTIIYSFKFDFPNQAGIYYPINMVGKRNTKKKKNRNVPINENKVGEKKTTNIYHIHSLPISNGTFKLEELGQ